MEELTLQMTRKWKKNPTHTIRRDEQQRTFIQHNFGSVTRGSVNHRTETTGARTDTTNGEETEEESDPHDPTRNTEDQSDSD